MIVRAMTVAALLLAGGLCPARAENCDDRVAGSCKPAPILVPTVTADDVATQAAEGRTAEPTRASSRARQARSAKRANRQFRSASRRKARVVRTASIARPARKRQAIIANADLAAAEPDVKVVVRTSTGLRDVAEPPIEKPEKPRAAEPTLRTPAPTAKDIFAPAVPQAASSFNTPGLLGNAEQTPAPVAETALAATTQASSDNGLTAAVPVAAADQTAAASAADGAAGAAEARPAELTTPASPGPFDLTPLRAIFVALGGLLAAGTVLRMVVAA